MGDNVIQFGKPRKSEDSKVGRGMNQSEFILADQDPEFNHRMEHSTTHNFVQMNSVPLEDIRHHVELAMDHWKKLIADNPEALDILEFEFTATFPGERNKPTAELFEFFHRVSLALLCFEGQPFHADMLAALSRYMSTARVSMFASSPDGASNKIAYGGAVGVAIHCTYWGVHLSFSAGSYQDTNFFC